MLSDLIHVEWRTDMSIVSDRVAVVQMGDDRPPLPVRPAPHERDGREGSPAQGRPHPQQRVGGAVRGLPGFEGDVSAVTRLVSWIGAAA
ncbi:hypothetical protein [Streptomyces griseofuscus]|uniref:hypothetical protein n=1 Tax=Streptomyces griseofuscus TaxID=146922 RepID=UPI0033DEBC88